MTLKYHFADSEYLKVKHFNQHNTFSVSLRVWENEREVSRLKRFSVRCRETKWQATAEQISSSFLRLIFDLQ